MNRVYVCTNGCEEGQLKSSHVREFLRVNGLTIVETPEDADMIIFFACGLTDEKEKDSLAIVKKLKSVKSVDSKLTVWGCLPKQNPRALKTVYDGPIVGARDTKFFDGFLEEISVIYERVSANTLVSKTTSSPIQVFHLSPLTTALIVLKNATARLRFPRQKWLFDESSFFIRVAEGCTARCTYCSELCAWGRVKSRPLELILSDFKNGLQRDYRRFFLVAGDLGSYGADTNCNFVDLLTQMIDVGGDKDYKIIINQMLPTYLNKYFPDLKDVLASGKIEALGCQVQSGSDRILKLMGRPYTAGEWRETMLEINRKFPYIRLSTHFLVGFPGETEEDFKATLKILDFPIFVDTVGIFKFSTRPSVYASKMPDQVPEEVKLSRCTRLFRKYLLMFSINMAVSNIRYLRKPAHA